MYFAAHGLTMFYIFVHENISEHSVETVTISSGESSGVN